MLSSISGKYFAGHLMPKKSLLPGATVYINFDLGSFPGSGTEWNNLQVWPNSALINPATKFAAERAYYGR
jgi:hypothetical protein